MKLRDYQRSKVYAWERSTMPVHNELLTLAECEEYAYTICSTYDLRPPKVKDGRGRSHAGGCASFITLPKWARNPWIVCHEMAHCYVEQRYQAEPTAAHGPEFIRAFIKFLDLCNAKPYLISRMELTDMGVDF